MADTIHAYGVSGNKDKLRKTGSCTINNYWNYQHNCRKLLIIILNRVI